MPVIAIFGWQLLLFRLRMLDVAVFGCRVEGHILILRLRLFPLRRRVRNPCLRNRLRRRLLVCIFTNERLLFCVHLLRRVRVVLWSPVIGFPAS